MAEPLPHVRRSDEEGRDRVARMPASFEVFEIAVIGGQDDQIRPAAVSA